MNMDQKEDLNKKHKTIIKQNKTKNGRDQNT